MKNNTRQTLKIYWQHTKKYPLLFWVCAIATILGALSTVVVPLFFRQFFDVLSTGIKDVEVVNKLVGILVFIGLGLLSEFIFWRIAAWANIPLETKVMANLSCTCFNYMHKHSFAYFNNNFVGSLVKRVNWFIRAFESLADKIVFNFIPTFTILIFAISVLIAKNLILGLIMLVWFVVFMVVNMALTNYKLKFDIARSTAESELTGVLADTITNNANVKLFCGYNREVSLFSSVADKAIMALLMSESHN